MAYGTPTVYKALGVWWLVHCLSQHSVDARNVQISYKGEQNDANAGVEDSLFGTDPLQLIRKLVDEAGRSPLGRRLKSDKKSSGKTIPRKNGNGDAGNAAKKVEQDDDDNKKHTKSSKNKGKGRNDDPPSSKSSKNRSSKSAGVSPSDGVDALTLFGDFSRATAETPFLETSFSQISEDDITLELTIPADTDVFLVTEAARRKLLDITGLSCPPPNGKLIPSSDNAGVVKFLIPGDSDSTVVLCSTDNQVIGAYYHDVRGGPTSSPTVVAPSTPEPTGGIYTDSPTPLFGTPAPTGNATDSTPAPTTEATPSPTSNDESSEPSEVTSGPTAPAPTVSPQPSVSTRPSATAP